MYQTDIFGWRTSTNFQRQFSQLGDFCSRICVPHLNKGSFFFSISGVFGIHTILVYQGRHFFKFFVWKVDNPFQECLVEFSMHIMCSNEKQRQCCCCQVVAIAHTVVLVIILPGAPQYHKLNIHTIQIFRGLEKLSKTIHRLERAKMIF